MSLNRKRRIFRPGPAILPTLARGAAFGFPAPGLLLAAAGGAVTLAAVTWLFIRPSDAPAHAPATQRLSAPATALAVIDGDTLRIGNDVVRLEGIAAPARGLSCGTKAAPDQDCGVAAANALASLILHAAIACTIKGHDDQGRPVATCVSAGTSVADALVRDGWARATTAAFRDSEAAARAAGRGIWRNGGDS